MPHLLSLLFTTKTINNAVLSHSRLQFLMNGGDVTPSMINQQLDSRFFPKVLCTAACPKEKAEEPKRVRVFLSIITK